MERRCAETKSFTRVHQRLDKIGHFRGAENDDILEVVLEEGENIVVEDYPSGSDEAVVRYVCHHCQRDFLSFNHLKTHLNICFFLFNPCILSPKAQKRIEEAAVAHGYAAEKYCAKPEEQHNTILYSCSFCSYFTPEVKSFEDHLAFIHAEDKKHSGKRIDRPYSCPYCKHRTVHSKHLKNHIISRHTNYKPHSCLHCDFRTTEPKSLKRHIMYKHSNDKPHLCLYCDYRTVESGNLKRHIMAKHTNDKPHSCSHCDYRTAEPTNLKRHVKYKHRNKV